MENFLIFHWSSEFYIGSLLTCISHILHYIKRTWLHILECSSVDLQPDSLSTGKREPVEQKIKPASHKIDTYLMNIRCSSHMNQCSLLSVRAHFETDEALKNLSSSTLGQLTEKILLSIKTFCFLLALLFLNFGGHPRVQSWY